MVKEFDEAVFNLPVNKVSAPVKTQYGYHLIMTTKKIPAVEAKGEAPAKPEMVKASHILVKIEAPQDVPKQEDLEKRLKAQETGKFARTFIMGLIQKAKITTSDEFKYLLPPQELPKEAKKGAVEKSEKK
jgi:parvulin-like peptidyl-prolyl isomerase